MLRKIRINKALIAQADQLKKIRLLSIKVLISEATGFAVLEKLEKHLRKNK